MREGLRYLRRLIELRAGRPRARAKRTASRARSSVAPARPWRCTHRAPAVWNRNGNAGSDHAIGNGYS
jgi:hypothetical protein